MIRARVFRADPRDALVLSAGLLHGAVALAGLGLAAEGGTVSRAVVALLLALGVCWGSNTVSHIHLHNPLFRSRAANAGFSLYLSLLLGVPQGWWKARHLVHHGAARAPLGWAGTLEIAAVVAGLGLFAALAPELFVTVWLPALGAGFGLCAIQGRQEHALSDEGVDHHGRLYNRLWFNDGFHAAHHRTPGAHWTALPADRRAADVVSRLPPVARWWDGWAWRNRLAASCIDTLERLTLGLAPARWFLVAVHRRAWRRLLADVPVGRIGEVTIVGGGLFPRTALVLADLLPGARLTIVDAVPAHLERARQFLGARPVRLVPGTFGAEMPVGDLLVVPLAFRGDRSALYGSPPAPLVVVHDWLWRARGTQGVCVSWLLCKRLNLVRRPG